MDDVPRGAVLGSALLAHWQDFAAVCSQPVVLVTEESLQKAALPVDWVKLGSGEGGGWAG